MKTILLKGFDASVSGESVRSWMESFGPVHRVAIFREGNAAAPLAVVEMTISDPVVAYVTSRITSYWHQGRRISARRLVY